MTSNVQNIEQRVPDEGPNQIIIGNGQGLKINAIGSTTFSSPFNHDFKLVLHNLLHVPSTTKNLLSVSQFAKVNSVFFEFHPNFCLVKSQGSNEVLLKGSVGKDGLYQFPTMLQDYTAASSFSSISSKCHYNVNTGSVNTIVSVSNFFIWHSRLGRPSVDIQKLLLTSCNIPANNKTPLDFCASCCLGKANRLPSHSSNFVYSQPLELIFSDLWDPTPFISINGFSYYISFVDAYNRFTLIYLSKHKSKTFNVFKPFKFMVEKTI